MDSPRQPNPLLEDARRLADQARRAAREVALASGAVKNRWLTQAAQMIRDRTPEIVAANAEDVSLAPQYGLNAAAIDRLTLTPSRIRAIAASLDEVAALPDPVGEAIHATRRPNGLEVAQIRVPLGVIFVIYESRPNVTVDAAALCLKSGNAAILRGGKEALHTNRQIYHILRDALLEVGLPEHSVQLVETTDRAMVGHLLTLNDQIDLAIPRGGESLIRRVVAEARMPVLKHYDGNCHVYVDASADPAMATPIIVNSKVQRPGVCNAAETLLVHRDIAETYLPEVARTLAEHKVELRGDATARQIVPSMTPATSSDWDTEYLDLILAVAVVDSVDAAIAHINRHGSKHTEVIVTSQLAASRQFVAEVDAAAVIVNASSRFNDGGQLGLGAEIGISTDKFHARGPCGLRELTTTKWIVQGNGQIRE